MIRRGRCVWFVSLALASFACSADTSDAPAPAGEGVRCGAGTVERNDECVPAGTDDGAGGSDRGGSEGAPPSGEAGSSQGGGAEGGGAGSSGIGGAQPGGGTSGSTGGGTSQGGADGGGSSQGGAGGGQAGAAGGGGGGGATSCADTQSDPNNCGVCGHSCPHLAGAVAGCVTGVCTQACDDTHTDCNGDLGQPTSDGCEASLADDPNHCGTCDHACAAGEEHEAALCVDFSCTVGCEPGFADCDLDLGGGGNGCEAQLDVDAANCGECNNICQSSCANSTCAGEPLCRLFDDVENVSLASDGTGFALAWREIETYPHDVLKLSLLDASGTPVGSPTLIADTNAYDRFAVAFDGSSYVLVWTTQYPKATQANVVYARRFAASDGSPRGPTMTHTFAHAVFAVSLVAGPGRVIALFNLDGETQVGAVEKGATDFDPFETISTLEGQNLTAVAPLASGYLTTWSLQRPATPPDMATHYGVGTLRLDSTGHGMGAIEDVDPTVNVSTTVLAANGDGAVLGVLPDIESALSFGTFYTTSFDGQGERTSGWHAFTNADPSPIEYGLESAAPHAWFESQYDPTIRVQALANDGTLTGAQKALAKAPVAKQVAFPPVLARQNDAGALFTWVRPRQVGSRSQVTHGLEAAFLDNAGVVHSPCE